MSRDWERANWRALLKRRKDGGLALAGLGANDPVRVWFASWREGDKHPFNEGRKT